MSQSSEEPLLKGLVDMPGARATGRTEDFISPPPSDCGSWWFKTPSCSSKKQSLADLVVPVLGALQASLTPVRSHPGLIADQGKAARNLCLGLRWAISSPLSGVLGGKGTNRE